MTSHRRGVRPLRATLALLLSEQGQQAAALTRAEHAAQVFTESGRASMLQKIR